MLGGAWFFSSESQHRLGFSNRISICVRRTRLYLGVDGEDGLCVK